MASHPSSWQYSLCLRTTATLHATSEPTATDQLGEADKISISVIIHADPSGRAVKGVCLPPLAYWEWGFESRQRHGCLSLASVVCCQLEVSTSGWSLVQRRPWLSRGCGTMEEKSSITGKMCPHFFPRLLHIFVSQNGKKFHVTYKPVLMLLC
jgi:hypothetical protein